MTPLDGEQQDEGPDGLGRATTGRLWDPSKIEVKNLARGGRSSRTYWTEGLWDRVMAELRPGDFVLMQFGHNDGGAVTGAFFGPGRR